MSEKTSPKPGFKGLERLDLGFALLSMTACRRISAKSPCASCASRAHGRRCLRQASAQSPPKPRISRSLHAGRKSCTSPRGPELYDRALRSQGEAKGEQQGCRPSAVMASPFWLVTPARAVKARKTLDNTQNDSQFDPCVENMLRTVAVFRASARCSLLLSTPNKAWGMSELGHLRPSTFRKKRIERLCQRNSRPRHEAM